MNSDLVSVLSTVQDPRSDKNKRYLLEEILLLCVCAAISGAGWMEKHSRIWSHQTELVA